MAQAHEKTILVVDDEPDVRYYLQTILEDAGFRVETAADGDEALEKVKASPPDFISLDLVMPRKSGRKLFTELKKNKQWSRIPVLIVTAHARDEMGQRDLERLLGPHATPHSGEYLDKPVNPDSYLRCIRRTLGVDEPPPREENAALREQVRARLNQASPESLRRALQALEQRSPATPGDPAAESDKTRKPL
ncbi:response regulator [Candidatus Sumerlaeota bacterium]|nr:response regulator [Candidatus Sumerlaeota bacterium]